MSTKKIILLIFSLGIHSAYAGMMRPACGLSDTAPCDTSAWEFGANALYLEETYANQPWKTEQSIINTLTGNQEAPVSLRGYGWGFFAEGAYHIGNDRAFTLNLYSLDNKHDVYNIIPNRGFRVIQQENKWLAVNFEVSQVIPVTDSDGIRGFAGFQYALISKERSFLRMAGNQAAFRGLQSITGQNNGYFSGFGPRFGVDLKYNLPCDLISGMSVYTKAAVEVLVGATRSKLFIVSNPADAIRDIYNRTAETGVVPEFDIKAGFNYKQATMWGDFTLDIGWMFFDYISAIVERFDAESSDVSFEGAYLGVKWVGNFA